MKLVWSRKRFFQFYQLLSVFSLCFSHKDQTTDYFPEYFMNQNDVRIILGRSAFKPKCVGYLVSETEFLFQTF